MMPRPSRRAGAARVEWETRPRAARHRARELPHRAGTATYRAALLARCGIVYPHRMRRSLCPLSLLAALGTLGACSATSVPIHGNDGKPYVYVDCSGMFQSLDDCYRTANEICPTGYRIMSSVAPRANPFGNLIVDCTSPGEASGAPGPTPTPAAL